MFSEDAPKKSDTNFAVLVILFIAMNTTLEDLSKYFVLMTGKKNLKTHKWFFTPFISTTKKQNLCAKWYMIL